VSESDAPVPDLQLLQRYSRGRDVASFTVLLDRHQADLLRLAHSLLGDPHGAQDAVQEAFCRLCRDAESLLARWAPGTGLGGWLCTVVRNGCIDHLRRRSQGAMVTLEAAEAVQPELPAEPAAEAVARRETGETLWSAVAELPPLERAAVVLRYRDGLSYQDIAERLDKTATHVGVILHQALGRLRGHTALKAGVMP
jgi:RNA polymerase sigma-70 factor (ECF subfamily)